MNTQRASNVNTPLKAKGHLVNQNRSQVRLLCGSSSESKADVLRADPAWLGLAHLTLGDLGWHQHLWELEESSRGERASMLGNGTGMFPFSRVGNCSGDKWRRIRGGAR